MKRLGVIFILIFAFGGLADSAYLAQHETVSNPLICNIQNLSGCNIVAQSPYSQIFGIPIAEYGILFYLIIFVIAALELVLFDRLLRRALQFFAIAGALASLYFTFLQMYVIHAFCIYCLSSAIITILIFILASFIEPFRKKASDVSPEPPHLSMPPAG